MIFKVANRAKRADFWRVAELAEFGQHGLNRADRAKSC